MDSYLERHDTDIVVCRDSGPLFTRETYWDAHLDPPLPKTNDDQGERMRIEAVEIATVKETLEGIDRADRFAFLLMIMHDSWLRSASTETKAAFLSLVAKAARHAGPSSGYDIARSAYRWPNFRLTRERKKG